MVRPENIETKDEMSTPTNPSWLKHFFFMGKRERLTVKAWWQPPCYENDYLETRFKNEVRKALFFVKYDYFISTLEPSYNNQTGKIYFRRGAPICISEEPDFWEEKTKEFAPDWNSRLSKWYELVLFYAYRVATGELSINYFSVIRNEKIYRRADEYDKHSASSKIGGFFDGIENTEKLTTKKSTYMISKRKYELGYFDLDSGNLASCSYFDFAPAGKIGFEKLSAVIVLRKKAEKPLPAKLPDVEKKKEVEPTQLSQAKYNVDALKEISDSTNFQESDKTISACVTKLYEILGKIKDNNLQYNRFAYLFEVYLPQFSKTLKVYATLLENDAVEPQDKKLFVESVKKFYSFLHSPKIDATADIEASRIEFNATAKTLIHTLDNEK